MHRIRRDTVLPPGTGRVAAERHELTADSPAHSHDFLECAIVTGGTAVHVSATGGRPLERGSAVLLRPGDWHGYRDCRRLTVHNVYISPELLRHELAWLRTDPACAAARGGPAPADPYRLDGDALALAEFCLPALAAAPASRAVRTGLLLCLLGAVLGTDAGGPAPVHPAVAKAVELLEDDPAADWSVGRLAAACGASEAYLARLFRRALGVAPMAYLSRLRAERAAALLIETDLPVAAVGRRVGWHDPNYASRRFRAHFGHAPARYRELFRAGRG